MAKESWRKENQWRSRVQEWMANLEAERQEQQIKFEKKRRRWREQVKQPDGLEAEVLSNKPTLEAGQSKILRVRVRPEYEISEIVQGVKEAWGTVWADESLESVVLWGKEWNLSLQERRTWIDGERLIAVAQPREERADIARKSRLGQENAPVNNFFRETDWRRERSRRWQEDHPNWKEDWRRNYADQVASGSEGQFLSHPIEVEAVVKGGLQYDKVVLATLVEGVRDDDPSTPAISGKRGGSYGPSLEAEIGTQCEDHNSNVERLAKPEEERNIAEMETEGDQVEEMAARGTGQMGTDPANTKDDSGIPTGSNGREMQGGSECNGGIDNSDFPRASKGSKIL
jgi:hypothetical protein